MEGRPSSAVLAGTKLRPCTGVSKHFPQRRRPRFLFRSTALVNSLFCQRLPEILASDEQLARMPQSTIAQWLKGSSRTPEIMASPPLHEPKLCADAAEGFKTPVADHPSSAQRHAPSTFQPRLDRDDSLPDLPANVTVALCTQDNIRSFRRLTSLLLPIQYPDSFYKETLEDEVIASITRVALWTPSDKLRKGNTIVDNLPPEGDDEAKVVAGIRCRMLGSPPHKPSTQEPVLYISTIGTLAPFRQLSLASHLLKEVFHVAINDYGVTSVYAHVWEENHEAMEWYNKRGFTILQQESGYYQKLAPKTDAWLIKRDIG